MSDITLNVIEDEKGNFLAIPEAIVKSTKEVPVSAKEEDDNTSDGWVKWGDNDDLPTRVRKLIERVDIAGATIYKLVQMAYGNGIAYYNKSDLQKAIQQQDYKISRAYNQEVEDFLKRNRIQTNWYIGQMTNFRHTMNAFSEFICDNNSNKITGVFHKEAEFCRLSSPNKQGINKELFYDSKFATNEASLQTISSKIPFAHWFHTKEEIQTNIGNKKRFARHSRFETAGVITYARPFWIGLFREDGWMEISSAVSEIVYSMMQNQIRLKYQIHIPESYFEVRYQDWHNKSDIDRNDIINTLIDTINNKLTGTKNAFMSISSVFKQDMQGNDRGKIEIVPIDDKVKKDSWVPSSSAADAKIVQGLGMHPSQMGLAPEGGKMGAGSGSDQRESFNTNISLNTIEQSIILEQLDFISDWNGWNVKFFIDHTYHTTTNKQEDGLQHSATTIQTK